jgi:streptogramin lyase
MFCELLAGLNTPTDCLLNRVSKGKRMGFAIFLFLITALLTPLASFTAGAQAANFVSFQRALPISLTLPAAVATDSSGNLYIADYFANQVIRVAPLPSGVFTVPVVVASIANPFGVAVDSSGVVYFSTPGTGTVYEVAPNGLGGYGAPAAIATLTNPYGLAVDSSFHVYAADYGASLVYKLTPIGAGAYTTSTIGTGWSEPVAVAVDSYGDVYVADELQPYIVDEHLSGGVYTGANIGNGDFATPTGVAVDYEGNVYVADNTNLVEYKLQPTAGGPYVESTVATLLLNPFGGAVDSLGNVYFVDGNQQAVIEVSNNFGYVGVGNTNNYNNRVEANFIFNTTTTLGGVSIESSGNQSGEFFNTSGGNCTVGTVYLVSDICYVTLGFTPQAPGERLGSIALTDSFGNLISTAGDYSGYGLAPRAGLLPGNWNLIAGGIAQTNFANAITLDGSGYIYTVASNNVYQTKNGGGTWTLVFEGNVHHATDAVVDGGGNVFVSTVDGFVFEAQPQPNGTFLSVLVVNEGDTIQGIAIDNQGNLFMTDADQQLLEEAIANNGSYNVVTLADFFFFDPDSVPLGVAVDAFDDVYVVDYYLGAVYAWIPQSNGFYYFYEAVRGLDAPVGVIVDPSLNLYITDTGRDTGIPTLYQAYLSNIESGSYSTSYSLFPIVSTIASYPLTGLAMDNAGNFYVTDDDALGNIYQVNLSAGTNLNFKPTALGAISTDSPQTVFLANTGNEPLAIFAPGSGQNPSVSPDFLLNGAGTSYYPGFATAIPDCAIVYPSGSSTTVSNDSTCALPISFEPEVSGPITGEVVVTDNSMDIYSQQIVTLNGTGLAAGTFTSVTSSLNPSTYGQQVTFTAEVSQTSGNQVPIGTLQFYLNGTLLGAPETLVDGVASYTTSTLAVGNDHIYAIYTPTNANFTGSTSGTLTQVVNLDSPTLTLTSSLNPSSYGQSVTFTFNAVPAVGTILPTGTVQFEVNGLAAGTPVTLVNGLATYTTNQIVVGTNTILAVFASATTNFASGSATLNQVVNVDTPTMTLTSSLNPSNYGQQVTFTAVITQASGTVTPTGSLQFYLNGALLGTPQTLIDGVASYTTNTIPVGSQTIRAVYTPANADFNTISGTLIQVVNLDTPLLTLSSSLNPSAYGQQVTLNFTAVQASGTIIPTGTVQLAVNGVNLGAAITLNNGVASLTTNQLAAGTLTITGLFTSATTNFANGTATLIQVVALDTPALSLTSTLNPSNYGQTVTFNFSALQTGGTIIPIGTVQFEVNGSPLGSLITLENGLASYTTNQLASGTLTVTAVFTSATADFSSGTATLIQIVNTDIPTITLTSSTNPSIYGQAVTFTAVVAQGSGTILPPGTVQFFSNGVPLAGAQTLVDGTATLTTSALTAGSWTITAYYTSSSPNFFSETTSLTQVVNKVTPVVSLTTSANPIFVTNTITVVASVTGFATNTGTFTFYDGTTALWSGAVGVNGVSLELPNLTVGTHSLTVVYSGNSNVSAGTSAAVLENVDDFTLVAATQPLKPILSGGTATYTFTVTPVGPDSTTPADINFTVTGAPPQSVVTVTTSPMPAGSGTTTVTMTVQVSPGLVLTEPSARPGMKLPATIAFALLLLPFAVRMRRAGRKLGKLMMIAILSIVGLATLVGLNGCGENFIPAFDLTMTATSGSLNHSTGVVLQVQ